MPTSRADDACLEHPAGGLMVLIAGILRRLKADTHKFLYVGILNFYAMAVCMAFLW